ncbi:DUF4190 domain-containing protein [Amycolatopsis roodepoortensis]|uniref:Septum formation-related domain-containing protein n=1 Tax=Amycolatopsis roodepoortensis TaxID=700274 RepID=A0ABR9L6P9_9PSEU|nr:DUF4190 domain-containing protein [Amycolatopsis roodepoortensis]MBE1575965.1 hypothetical protein [Amycolatopsis roodepoortensis]
MYEPQGPGTPIAQPYGYAYPPGPPPQRPKTSGLAIAALVLGLAGCLLLPLLPAFILGIMALSQTGPGKQQGRGLAIGGLAAAAFWTIGWIALAKNTMGDLDRHTASPPSASCATPPAGHANICTLKPGDCLQQPMAAVTSVELAVCESPHTTEVFGAFTAADGPWPSGGEMKAEALEHCQRIAAKNVDLPRLNAEGVYTTLGYLKPEREPWEGGVRTIFCTIYSPDSQLTGSALVPGADLSIPTG